MEPILLATLRASFRDPASIDAFLYVAVHNRLASLPSAPYRRMDTQEQSGSAVGQKVWQRLLLPPTQTLTSQPHEQEQEPLYRDRKANRQAGSRALS